MNTKLAFAKEAGKLAAYAFVVAGLVTTTAVQFAATRVSFLAAFKK